MTRRHISGGFTIIEVMLFLAITGLMLAGVFVAISGSINRQRYHDATTSFTDFLQGQYNTVDNVRSNRSDAAACDASGVRDSGNQPRGTSACSVIGRYISTLNGSNITSRPIYATADVTAIDMATSETELIDALELRTAPDSMAIDDSESYTLAWNTHVYTDGNQAARDFRIVLVKLPTNGLIRTYFTTSPGSDVESVIAATAAETINLCVASDGLVSTPATGAKLLRTGSGVNGVQPIIPSEGGC